MWISPRVRPLLTTDNPNSDPILAWVGPCPLRVVAIQLGHGPSAFAQSVVPGAGPQRHPLVGGTAQVPA